MGMTTRTAIRSTAIRRTALRSTAIVAAGLLLTACGSGDGAADPSASANPSTGPSATSSILIWSDPAHAGALEASAAAHQQATGVEVLVQTVGTDLTRIRDDITTLAPQGQGPDLFVGQSDWVGRLADFGLLAPVDLAASATSFRPVSVQGFTYQARTYGVPFATENLALFRNTALAPEAPESIDVMARDGLELKDKDDTILPIALPVGPQGDAYHWYPFYSAAGGKIFGLDAQGGYTADELEVGKPGSIEAAERLAQLTEDGALDAKATLDSALTAFTSGRAPYLISGPWSVDAVRQAGIPFIVEPVPGFDSVLASRSQAMVTSQGLLQSAFARNAAGAQEYLATTAMTTGVMSALAAPGGLAPAWVDSYAVAASDPVIKGFGTYADTSAPMPNLAEMDQVWPSLSRAQVDVMSGANPTKTMKAAGSEIQSAIDAS
jgi:arabinogalactan oligomer/maltooligosaccharide transport system substrate-binding protein